MRAFAGGTKKPFKLGSPDDDVHVPEGVVKSPRSPAAPAGGATAVAKSPRVTEGTSPGNEPTSPKAKDGEVPVWKQRQLLAEQETRERLAREAQEKQKQVASSVHHGPSADDVPTYLSPRMKTDADHVDQTKTLSNFLKSDKVDVETAKQAAEAERERLESIFKAKPTTGKNRFTAVSEEAKANMATANARAEEENKREEARESERAAAAAATAAKLTKERTTTAEKALADAYEHYDSAMAGELHLNELERGIAAEIATLRADPRAYAVKLVARRAAYDGNVLTLHDPAGPTLRIKTTDGVAAVDEAIRVVERAHAAPLALERALVRAMFTAVREDKGRPNAVANVANYGTVSGSARQIVYRGPIIDAADVVTAILVDDGQADRSRRDALLADKFKHFGVAANIDEKGQYNYCYILLISQFAEKPMHK